MGIVTGTLGLFSLVDLFQLLAASSRSGRLTVDHPQGAARVYFEEGLAVHAEFSGYTGEDAVYALFSDEQGSFEFMLGVPAPRTTIETSTENLMLEASRRLDEARRGEPLPQPVETGPFGEPLRKEEAGQRSLPPRTLPERRKGGFVSDAGANAAGSDEPELLHEAPEEDAGAASAPDAASVTATPSDTSAQPASREPPANPKAPPATEGPESAHAPEPRRTAGSGIDISLTAVPSFAEKAKTVADMSLSKEEVSLLREVDGKRNVAGIAREAGIAEEVARVTVKRFVDLGVLRLSSRKPRTARLVTKLTRVKLPHGIAGVDPSIMTSWEKSLGYRADSVACRLEDGRVCLLGAMPLDNAGPYLMINRETLLHADLAVNQPLLVKPVPQSEV